MSERVWTPDRALDGFESITLPLTAEDDGELCATLVRRARGAAAASVPVRRAVLYVHGFIDYFFQAHVADAFDAAGWDFYALDLRRYGRSLRAQNRPNYCTDLAQYDAEISAAINIIRADDKHEIVALMGHSTGGLITSWYAHRGARRTEVNALVLNSPFFVNQAKAFSGRVQKEATDEGERIRRAYLLAYGRPARSIEVEIGLRFLAAKDDHEETSKNKLTRWERYSQALLAANEFLYVD